MSRIPSRLAFPSLLLLALSAPALALQTDNHGIHAVPVPGPVVIDGGLTDWDLSGQVQMCYDLDSLADIYSGRVAMMHDADHLYVGIHWKDPIPMGNCHDPRYQGDKGWAGDSVQLRFKTDRITHITAWCFAGRQEPFIGIDYGKSLTEPFGGGTRTLFRSDGWKLSDGAEQAFAKDADGKGYVQEIKLPWALITAGKRYAPGERFACGIELLWGEADWPLHRYADNLAEGATSREFFWTAHNAWGPVIIEAAGKLSLPKPAYLAALDAAQPAGPVEVAYDLAKDGRVTVAIDDAQGRRVRNLVAAQPRKAGRNVERWDGMDDAGKPLPPGDYRFSGLAHDGIHANWVLSFCNPGNPTWDSGDGTGAFYGDHSNPQGAAAAGEFVALACPMGEAGRHLIGLNLEGQRLWGLNNRTAFDGGFISLATDGKVLWVANDAKESTIYRVDIATGTYSPWKRTAKDSDGRDYQVLDLKATEQPGYTSKPGLAVNLAAIAVRGGTLAVCLAREGKVQLRDAASGEVRSEVMIEAPRGVTFVKDDELLVLSGEGIERIVAGARAGRFGDQGFAAGRSLSSDAKGNVYVAVRGAAQNISVLGPDGRLLREIGGRGGRPAHGPYDASRMREPAQIAVDSMGRLWVAEETGNPKRTSLWSTVDGSLIREFVGTTGYAGAGALNPDDPSMAFAEDTVFAIDLASGAWKPVYSLAGNGHPDDLFPPKVHNTTNRTITRDGLTYVFTTGSARGATEVHCTMRGKDGAWRSAAHLGVVRRKGEGEWAKYLHPHFEGQDGRMYAWADADGDGVVQKAELAFGDPAIDGTPKAVRSHYWGQLPDLQGTVIYLVDGEQALYKFPITGTTACGAPLYDVAKPRVVRPDQPVGGGNGEGMVLGGSDGRVYINQDPLICVEDSGKVLGGYPNRHTSVHGSHSAKAPRAGYLIGPSSILGTADLGKEIGEVFYLNGNLGENYLFTHDGLWIQGLFKDTRGWFEMPGRAVRGMAFDATSAGGESFGGNFVRARNGKTYVVLGATDARVLEITGLESIRRFAGGFAYTQQQYVAAQDQARERALAMAAATAKDQVVARATTPITVDGKADEWPELLADGGPVIEVQEDQHRRYGRAQLRWDETSLYVAWRVKAPANRMRNAGQDHRLLFKSGECVDVLLADDQHKDGLRLLVSEMAGTPIAVLYEKTVPGTAEADRVPFSSPWRTIHFDRVTRLSEAKVAVGAVNGGYLVEAQVPWSRLGITPVAGMVLRGDIGILGADGGGRTTISRQYWSNKNTGLVNDVPGEAELTPGLWGRMSLK